MPELENPEGATPAQTPVAPANPEQGSLDFEKFKTELMGEVTKALDTRFSGFQSIIDKRDTESKKQWKAYQETLNELKSRTLSDEEREQLEAKAGSQELEALRMENELLKMKDEYGPEIVSTFERLLSAETPRDQLEIMKAFRSPNEQPQQPATQPESPATPSAPVDPNNPVSEAPVDGSDWEAQFEKDPSLADKILKRLNG